MAVLGGGCGAADFQATASLDVRSLSERFTYPCEIYVAAFAIEGLEPGFYHFSVGEFALRKLREGYEALAQIKRGRPDLEFLKTLPAVLMVSTIFCRSSWAFGKRGYRQALLEAGHVIQNIATVGTGLGIQTLVRLTANAQTMRELIGVAADADFAEAEAVQGSIAWADATSRPLTAPPGFVLPPVGALPTLPRPPLAASVVGYGSILAVHEDCVAPGVAVREIRPPLTELSPLSDAFDFQELPEPEAPERGIALDKLLLNPQVPREFAHASISRDRLWYLARVGFRWGSPFPLFPDGPYSALIRPIWIITNVIGVDNGIWYYHPAKNAWMIIRNGVFRYDAQRLSMSNVLFGNASAACFMTANLYRLLNEGGPDVYRLAHLEAGMAAQRMSLCAPPWVWPRARPEHSPMRRRGTSSRWKRPAGRCCMHWPSARSPRRRPRLPNPHGTSRRVCGAVECWIAIAISPPFQLRRIHFHRGGRGERRDKRFVLLLHSPRPSSSAVKNICSELDLHAQHRKAGACCSGDVGYGFRKKPDDAHRRGRGFSEGSAPIAGCAYRLCVAGGIRHRQRW